MISMDDCLGFCDASPEDIDRIARTENLPPILAAMKAHSETHRHDATGARGPGEAQRGGRGHGVRV